MQLIVINLAHKCELNNILLLHLVTQTVEILTIFQLFEFCISIYLKIELQEFPLF